MRNMILTAALLMLTANCSNAQFYKSVLPSPEFTSALEKIVTDFRLNYESIKGEPVDLQKDVASYESLVKIPGAKECMIYYYNSLLDTSASWQATMYRGEDYDEAARTYENVFRLVKKSRMKWIDRSLMRFSGELERPKDDLTFAVSNLNFDLEDPRYKNYEAEVELLKIYEGWVVHLNLQTRKPDTEGYLKY